jgi:3-hydroxybutyryl-CoA dehydratase
VAHVLVGKGILSRRRRDCNRPRLLVVQTHMAATSLHVGFRISEKLVLNDDEIIAGARFLNDRNPLHNDVEKAGRSKFGGLIACGPHVSGIHACMLPTHCTELGYDVLGTVFTVRYTAPVLAQVALELSWTIASMSEHRSGGQLVDWQGTVGEEASGRICIDATGQVLLTPSR